MKTKQITIPQPCNQQWEHMQQQDEGRFCNSCAKTVTDFTAYDDAAFIAYFQHIKTKPCGRFTQRQLALEIPIYRTSLLRPVKYYKYLTAGLLSIVSIPFETQAKQAEVITLNAAQHSGPEIQQSLPPTGAGTLTIKGKVVDEKGKHMPAATITIQGTDTGLITDFDGNFALDISADKRNSTVLLVTSVGYGTKRVSLADYGDNITISLTEPAMLGGPDFVMVKPSLWKRITKPFRKRH
jgi:hypothetical protein